LVRAAILFYAETKEKEGSRQIPTILKTAEIGFAENTITLTINNETQKEQFLLIKQSFVDALRGQLQNSKVNLEIEISKSEMQVKAYKPIDIFKSMSEKNPALLELKKRFDLEIDY
jgi:DNA polymerase-3 subunit gamma/tau